MMENETELVTKLRELSNGFACPPAHAAPRSEHACLVAELASAADAAPVRLLPTSIEMYEAAPRTCATKPTP